MAPRRRREHGYLRDALRKRSRICALRAHTRTRMGGHLPKAAREAGPVVVLVNPIAFIAEAERRAPGEHVADALLRAFDGR